MKFIAMLLKILNRIRPSTVAKMTLRLVVIGPTLCAAFATQVHAQDTSAVQRKAAVCFGCHGPNGKDSPNPLWPNLAGQKAGYLLKQMTAFKSGERKDPLMTATAQTLSEQDMKDLAEYFASLIAH